MVVAADLSLRSAARIEPAGDRRRGEVRRRSAAPTGNAGQGIFFLLAAAITLASVVSTVISVHLLTVLQAKGIALAAAASPAPSLARRR